MDNSCTCGRNIFSRLGGVAFFLLLLVAPFVQVEAGGKPFTVVIDAGHGGKDPGSTGYTLKLLEKTVNLKTALKLGAKLEKEEDVRVVYTRKKDVFIPLDDRAQVANKAKADLFISIHANAADNRSARGTETYSVGSSTSNLEVAMRENAVILYESDYKTKYKGFDNSSESYIMFDFIQSKYNEQSIGFASGIERQFKAKNRYSRGVKQAGFWVLKQTSMPAVLVELGYLSNLEEERFLSKDANLDIMAESIYKAFVNYKKRIDKKDGTSYNEVEKSVENKVAEKKAEPQNTEKKVEEKKEVKPVEKEVSKAEKTAEKAQPQKEPLNVQEKKEPLTVSSTDDLRYAVQIGSFSTQIPLNSRDFRGFVPAREFLGTGTYKYKYVYGNEENYEEAISLREEVRKKFPDAFMVIILNGRLLSNEEARQINWGCSDR